MLDQEAFYESVRTFLRTQHPERQAEAIDPTSNLFDLGYVDSLSMVELILYLEQLVGREIAIERYPVRSFHTLERMYDIAVDAVVEGS